jgi:hypothetical protein
MSPLSELLPGTRCVILCRVSSDSQPRSGNLNDQQRALRPGVKRQGCKVVGVFGLDGLFRCSTSRRRPGLAHPQAG